MLLDAEETNFRFTPENMLNFKMCTNVTTPENIKLLIENFDLNSKFR